MLTVADKETYQRYRETKTMRSELWLSMLLFGSMGAITWAIRGSDGWGGVDGTIIPGMTWGLLWYYVCYRKGIDARGIPLWLGLGIALGGELGYGQYVSWIQGKFAAGDSIIPVAPWMGYAWFVICGIGWGAPGGILLGWALGGKVSRRRWLVRTLVPLGFGIAGWLFVEACPWLFFPNYRLGLYTGELNHHLIRTIETNRLNFSVVAWWAGALLVAALQRDRATIMMGLIIGGGFGFGFTLAALWCLGYTYAPGLVDWWKIWELNAGFNLGLLYTIALYWAMRCVDRTHHPNGEVLAAISPAIKFSERGRNISLLLAVFLLVFITCFGATNRVGILMGLYQRGAVDQYQWPLARVVLFAPAAVLILGTTLYKAWRIFRPSGTVMVDSFKVRHLPQRMVVLMVFIGIIGVVTMWPTVIALFYVIFLGIALLVFRQLHRG
ncbi:MAG TPA: hypothetical protein PLI09_15315 [Candidatus Hydrogenedentes bacterium]|nr:hypothetical protein [Candidatus Hydrogenedentota bacterium]